MSPSARRYCLLFGALLLSAGVHAASPGTLIRAAQLKSQPFIDASSEGELSADSPLTILVNQGGWTQVRTADGKTGWVRLLNVRPVPVADGSAESRSAIDSVLLRTGSTKATATTGVKGLSREDIANARPNPGEVQRLGSYAVRSLDIDRFAASRHLVARSIPELKP